MSINSFTMGTDGRLAAIRTWLEDLYGNRPFHLEPASDDASFRRYFRLQTGTQSFIVMDAPPDKEDCRPFIRVSRHLDRMGLNATRVLAADLEHGFVLLTDLGKTEYLSALQTNEGNAPSLYRDALNALAVLQREGRACQHELPPYDDALLRRELALFHDWLCGTHLELGLSVAEETAWAELCDVMVHNALSQPQVYVHRDYHSRNLMLDKKKNPGLLDFQDAVQGPLTYDLVSLLKDCYIRWPEADVTAWAGEFFGQLDTAVVDGMDQQQFMRHFDLMGVQRHLKASGIFARLNHRDGKARYLADVPMALNYIVEVGPRYRELAFVTELITDRMLPRFERLAQVDLAR